MREVLCTRCDSIHYIQSNARPARCPQCSLRLNYFPFNAEASAELPRPRTSRSERPVSIDMVGRLRSRQSTRQLAPSSPSRAVAIEEFVIEPIDSPVTIDLTHEEARFNRERQGRIDMARHMLDFRRMEFLSSRFNGLQRFIDGQIGPMFDLASEDSEPEFLASLGFSARFMVIDPPARAKPSKKELLKKITTSRIGKQKPDLTCSICLSGYRPNQRASELPCKHLFHKSCLRPWLNEADTCPVCRQPILSEIN